jgi:catechol 2,3-dioxygenase-like lactoylglutathione lyase family enzyme
MLLSGINHVAVLTKDTDRLHAFYRDVFDAEVFADETISEGEQQGRLSFVTVGPHTQLNVFELPGNAEAEHQTPMFGRGRIDHMGLQAASQEAFDEIRRRLIERGCTDGFVTDFGVAISLFFIDPDGLEGEVLLDRPGAGPADLKPPGTPAAGYERVAPEQ